MLLFVATLVAVALLGLVEWIARVTTAPPPEIEGFRAADFFAELLEPCFESGAPSTPPGTLRIFIIGESSAQMLGGRLQDIERAARTEDFHIFNCAQGGASLPHVELRFQEVLAYEPDAIILLFGHNTFNDITMDRRWIRMAQWARRSRLVHLLLQEPLSVPFERSDRHVELLGSWLDEFAQTTADRGIRTQVSVPVGNLWYAPEYEDDEAYQAVMEARVLATLGRVDEAVARLQATRKPSGHFELGLLFAAQGHLEQAREELIESRDPSASRSFRAPSEVLTLIRNIGSRPGIELIDGEALLEEQAGGTLDWSWFMDACHLSPRGFTLLANEHLRRLVPGFDAITPVEPNNAVFIVHSLYETTLPHEPHQRWEQGYLRSIALSAERWMQDGEIAAKVREWLGSPNVQGLAPARQSWFFAGIAQGMQAAGLEEEAATLYGRAPAPTNAFTAVEWGHYLLAAQGGDAARSVVEPFAREFPANVFLEFLDEHGPTLP